MCRTRRAVQRARAQTWEERNQRYETSFLWKIFFWVCSFVCFYSILIISCFFFFTFRDSIFCHTALFLHFFFIFQSSFIKLIKIRFLAKFVLAYKECDSAFGATKESCLSIYINRKLNKKKWICPCLSTAQCTKYECSYTFLCDYFVKRVSYWGSLSQTKGLVWRRCTTLFCSFQLFLEWSLIRKRCRFIRLFFVLSLPDFQHVRNLNTETLISKMLLINDHWYCFFQ